MTTNDPTGEKPDDAEAYSPTNKSASGFEIEIVATGDDLAFATTENAPAHADAVLKALRARLPVARYAEGATVATLTDWKLHTLEVTPYE